jgi:hypothetical protein
MKKFRNEKHFSKFIYIYIYIYIYIDDESLATFLSLYVGFCACLGLIH